MPALSGRGPKGNSPMTPTRKIALEGGRDLPRELHRESPAHYGAFVSRMASNDARSRRLAVALCCQRSSFRRTGCSAAGDSRPCRPGAIRKRRRAARLLHRQRARLCRDRRGSPRPGDRRHRPPRSLGLEGLPAVLVCRRAVVADIRRALELGVDGIVLGRAPRRPWAPSSRPSVRGRCRHQRTAPGASRASIDDPRETGSDAGGRGADQLADRGRAVPGREHRQEPSVVGLREAGCLLSQRSDRRHPGSRTRQQTRDRQGPRGIRRDVRSAVRDSIG